MKKYILPLALAALFASTAFAETKQAVYTVNPQMSCQNCENKIKSNLRFEKGIKKIETSLKDQTVTVTYDDTKTDSEKIIAGFKKVGYTAVASDGKAVPQKGCCAKTSKCENKEESKCEGKCGDHCKNHKN
ncbi:MAG: heavy-metal-associated domain-containing protein [Muribaculaceae bacterium]|nr:heavy-metal-associated domain-containing protein [Muribaculaceae bacterium]